MFTARPFPLVALLLIACPCAASAWTEELPTPVPAPPAKPAEDDLVEIPSFPMIVSDAPKELAVPPSRPQFVESDIAWPVIVPEEIEALEPELITERYPNRAVKLQRQVVQDEDRNYVNHGTWTMMDEQGEVIAQGEYRQGKRHGHWMRVLSKFGGAERQFKPPFVSQAEFLDDQLHGTWTVIDAEQRVVGSWQFSHNELDGVCATWYPNGQQQREMTFVKGVPDGTALAWKPDGQLWSKEFYREGKQLIPSVTWHDQEQKKSEGWLVRSNVKVKVQLDWWEGVLEIKRDDSRGEEVKTGEWTEWYANGNLRTRGMYDEGVPVGQHTWWHENGQRQEVGEYKSGLAEGLWTRWYASGQKQEEGQYLAGVKSGAWTTWGTDGQIADVRQMSNPLELARDQSGFSPRNVSHRLDKE